MFCSIKLEEIQQNGNMYMHTKWPYTSGPLCYSPDRCGPWWPTSSTDSTITRVSLKKNKKRSRWST